MAAEGLTQSQVDGLGPPALKSHDDPRNHGRSEAQTQESSEGHRARLLSRFEEHGIASLADYEIVELILTFVIPRKDTKATAKALLKRYKTIGALLNAEASDVSQVNGIGRRASMLLRLFRDVTAYCLAEKCEARRPLLHGRDVEQYLRFDIGFRGEECVAVLFLDNGNSVVGTEIVCQGTVDQCAVYPRTILEKALRCKAAAIILAHNHPGGSPIPSEADWQITERLFEAGRQLEIPLLDHIIVSRETATSLRALSRWPKSGTKTGEGR